MRTPMPVLVELGCNNAEQMTPKNDGHSELVPITHFKTLVQISKPREWHEVLLRAGNFTQTDLGEYPPNHRCMGVLSEKSVWLMGR